MQEKIDRLEQKIIELQIEREELQWLLDKNNEINTCIKDYIPFYGDVTELNTERTILDFVGKENLKNLTSELMDLLDTSVAVYEKNGDYAYGMLNSGWCRLLDAASRKLCKTDNNKEALKSPKWLCRFDCWSNSAKKTIETGKSIDSECVGGIELYSEPIFCKDEIIGTINIGYGNPPQDHYSLYQLSQKFNIDYDILYRTAKTYKPRPPFIVEIAKKRLKSIAKLIGEIVARKKAEQALIQSREEYKKQYHFTNSLLQALPIPVFYKDKEGRYIGCNKAFEEFTGKNEEQIKNKTVFELWKTNLSNKYHQKDIELIEQGGKQHYEFNVSHFDKSERNVIFNKSVYYNENNVAQGIIGCYVDITERKKIEKKLKLSEKKYRELFEQNTDSITIFKIKNDGKPSKIIDLNENAAKIIGYTKKEVQKKSPPELEKTSNYEKIVQRINDLKKYNYSNFETILKHKSGRDVYVKVKLIPIKYKGEPALMNITHDITEFKKSQEKNILNNIRLKKLLDLARNKQKKLEKLNRDKDTLLSILAHDLKNPFNTLFGYISLLLMNMSRYDKEQIKQKVEMIKLVGEQTYSLLEDILLWAKSQAGKISFIPKFIDFKTICIETIELVRNEATKKNITINCICDELQTIYADENMFRIILRNLLSNAVKFTNKQGEINIASKINSNYYEIIVEDNGIGIDIKHHPKLWDITSHYSTTGTANEEGSGFGLAICKELVEKHGGEIRVESEKGEGSKFIFTIPNYKEKSN